MAMLRFKNCTKRDMLVFGISPKEWEELAKNCKTHKRSWFRILINKREGKNERIYLIERLTIDLL